VIVDRTKVYTYIIAAGGRESKGAFHKQGDLVNELFKIKCVTETSTTLAVVCGHPKLNTDHGPPIVNERFD